MTLCVSHSSHCCDKRNLKKEGRAYFGSQSKGTKSILEGKAWQQDDEELVTLYHRQETERAECWCSSNFIPFTPPRTLSPLNGSTPTHLGWVFPPQAIQEPTHICTHQFVFWVILEPIEFATDINCCLFSFRAEFAFLIREASRLTTLKQGIGVGTFLT